MNIFASTTKPMVLKLQCIKLWYQNLKTHVEYQILIFCIYTLYDYEHQFIPPTKKTYPIIVSALHKSFHLCPHNSLMREEPMLESRKPK